ncbi:hypothetical protein RUND412_011140 [Rhizina undulata]
MSANADSASSTESSVKNYSKNSAEDCPKNSAENCLENYLEIPAENYPENCPENYPENCPENSPRIPLTTMARTPPKNSTENLSKNSVFTQNNFPTSASINVEDGSTNQFYLVYAGFICKLKLYSGRYIEAVIYDQAKKIKE